MRQPATMSLKAADDSIGGGSAAAEEESFIILGSSPSESLAPAGESPSFAEDHVLKDFTTEAGQAFRAHFKLDHDAVSECSMSLAERAVQAAGDDLSSLTLHVASLLDENVILRETLRSNNAAVRDKLLQLAVCQDDVSRTQRAHRDKFRETRLLVERLRAENAKLQEELVLLRSGENKPGADPVPVEDQTNGDSPSTDSGAGTCDRGSLAYEFVASPDDDTLHKLTEQLELVERQRRQVISENEALTWQKESLERLLDATSADRDRRGDQLAAAQVEIRKQTAILNEKQTLIQELRSKLDVNSHLADTVSLLQDQLQELRARLQDTQPVKLEPSWSGEVSAEGDTLGSNAKLYEKSLQHLAQLLNNVTSSSLESLVSAQELCVEASRHGSREEMRTALTKLQTCLQDQHSTALQHTGQVRVTVSIFDSIFRDYQQVLAQLKESNVKDTTSRSSQPVLDTLTSALVSRDEELQRSALEMERLRALVITLQRESDEREHLRAQLQVYRDDFTAERASRESLACEKDNLLSELRGLQHRNQELAQQLDEVRRINPNIYQSATTKRGAGPRTGPPATNTAVGVPAASTANTVYSCPKCRVFSCSQYRLIEEHVNRCLDN